ncbi:MAG: hypothetical protein Q4C64_05160 [Erysipelotrichia bacterium]|nr:hypothetical protein [Erysipelotrichia bacterium]
MISINSPKASFIAEKLAGKEIDGVNFELVKMQGMSVIMKTNDDAKAKIVVKSYIGSMPEMKYKVLTVGILDDQGRLI